MVPSDNFKDAVSLRFQAEKETQKELEHLIKSRFLNFIDKTCRECQRVKLTHLEDKSLSFTFLFEPAKVGCTSELKLGYCYIKSKHPSEMADPPKWSRGSWNHPSWHPQLVEPPLVSLLLTTYYAPLSEFVIGANREQRCRKHVTDQTTPKIFWGGGGFWLSGTFSRGLFCSLPLMRLVKKLGRHAKSAEGEMKERRGGITLQRETNSQIQWDCLERTFA